MESLRQGQVILVEVTDPRGANPKPRPAVILTATGELAEADEFVVAAISTKFSDPLPSDCLWIPWSPDGRARTGLKEPSVVKCRWLKRVRPVDVIRPLGHVSASVLVEVMRRVTQE